MHLNVFIRKQIYCAIVFCIILIIKKEKIVLLTQNQKLFLMEIANNTKASNRRLLSLITKFDPPVLRPKHQLSKNSGNSLESKEKQRFQCQSLFFISSCYSFEHF